MWKLMGMASSTLRKLCGSLIGMAFAQYVEFDRAISIAGPAHIVEI
jgi:hypothetical protein